ncbi:tetratricopeptide repeat protein [Pedobacter cryoconitis]|uniref:Outer membrane protein assembly factor BamD (BamD/ComL family) n=1 Tax=Pedobacter cryoconitis TaxID=188932 RepID=A0A327S1M9_9SPHI|nr:tetratricopeptide repeat protein [Pedobacter cryoconitis]RAJ22909.1 outer membrane protein assembly factor BamD (BamD/ComL family) [Pedobacter cryoconitis]
MNYIKKALILFLVVSANAAFAQSGSYDKLGMQAMMKGDYKGAVAQLEKADAKTPNNPSVLKMLGYSYFQCGNFESSIETYSRLITVKPSDYSAYYYRGKARQNVANDPKESLNQMRETFYQSAIKDFSKAIEINGEEDTQLLQNRGLAYKDYAIYKSYKIKKRVDKDACIVLFNNSVADFQKVLTVQPLRKDIISLIDYVKAQVASLK